MDVRMPDGTIIKNIPDGITKAELVQKLQANGHDVTGMTSQQQPAQPAQEAPSGFVKGLRDPIDAGAQMLTKILPDSVVNAGNSLNNWIADKTGLVASLPPGGVDQQVRQNEQKYQAQRAAAGKTGIDLPRLAGNILNPANLAIASKIPQVATLAGRVGLGALSGSISGAAQPVTKGDFWTEKGKQAGTGALMGGALPVVTSGAARLISPKASINPDVAMLRNAGVKPTIGQTLGGVANWTEQKATSIPIVGDMISNARRKSIDQFNNVAINRAVSPIGGQVDEIGHTGISNAGNMISDAYNKALKGLKGVTLDGQGKAELSNLKNMSVNMPDNTKRQFNTIIKNVVEKRLSPAGGMAADTFKLVESELQNKASKYSGSMLASEKELGDGLHEALRILRDQAARQNPRYAKALSNANAGWANLVRIEGAGKAAANNGGVFSPAQLMSAVRGADKSVRDRATARGSALMQDLAGAGQRVLGSTYPDSGTIGRAGLIGTGMALASNPVGAIGGLLGGAAAYTPAMQKILGILAASRPKLAIPAANSVRNSAPFLTPGLVPVGYGLLGKPQHP